MKTITLEVSEDMARELLPGLYRQRDDASERLRTLNRQIHQIESSLGIEKFSIVHDGQHRAILTGTVAVKPEKTAAGRNKKGASIGIITDFLKLKNGTGATIKEIIADTGTTYQTARRILLQLQHEEKVSSKNGYWQWISA